MACRFHRFVNHSLPDLAVIGGLSVQEAQRRLKQEGYNELPSSRRRSLPIIALNVVREPMFLLLLAGGGTYLALGEIREALVLLGSILVIMSITFYQEQKHDSPAHWTANRPHAARCLHHGSRGGRHG